MVFQSLGFGGDQTTKDSRRIRLMWIVVVIVILFWIISLVFYLVLGVTLLVVPVAATADNSAVSSTFKSLRS